jgi:hypothetical protein
MSRDPRQADGLSAVREAVANVLSRPLLTLLRANLVAAAIVSPAISVANSKLDVVRYTSELRMSGYDTLVVKQLAESGTRTSIDAADCERLTSLPGTVAAGAALADTSFHLWTSNGPPLTIWRLSPALIGAARSLGLAGTGLDKPPAGIVDGAQLPAGAVHLVSDTGKTLNFLAVRISLGYLGAGLASSYAIPDVITKADRCLVVVRHTHRQSILTSVAARFPVSDGYLVTWSLEGANQMQTDIARWKVRQMRLGWIFFPVTAATVLALDIRLRRTDIAVYRLMGIRDASVATLLLAELGIAALLGLGAWAPVIFKAIYVAGDRTDIPLQVMGASASALCLLMCTACLVAGRLDRFWAVRDR